MAGTELQRVVDEDDDVPARASGSVRNSNWESWALHFRRLFFGGDRREEQNEGFVACSFSVFFFFGGGVGQTKAGHLNRPKKGKKRRKEHKRTLLEALKARCSCFQ